MNNEELLQQIAQLRAEVAELRELLKPQKAERKILFANSRYTNLDAVASELKHIGEGVNLSFYRQAIMNWSDQEGVKRTERGWLATYRTFIARDAEKGILRRSQAWASR